MYLSILVERASATLRIDPVDVLLWVLDVASFTMHAIGEVDLQARL